MTPSQKMANLTQCCEVMTEDQDVFKEREVQQEEEEDEDASSISGVFEEDA